LLFAEETLTAQLPDPDVSNAQSGLLYEVKFANNDPTTVEEIKARSMIRSLAHEGIEVDDAGSMVIDEDHKGSIYKFDPILMVI
jgi:hypothetical protein